MSYPDNFSTAAYDAIYGRDRIEPRKTNAVELAAMRDLRRAGDLMREAKRLAGGARLSLPETAPYTDAIDALASFDVDADWLGGFLLEAVREIDRAAEREAEAENDAMAGE